MGLFSNKQKDFMVAIENAYMEEEGEMILTNIDFKHAEKFIKNNGGRITKYDDGGIGGSLTLEKEYDVLHITCTQSRRNGNAVITVYGDNAYKEVTKDALKDFLNN